MTSKTPLFPGWKALAGQGAESRLDRAAEERRALFARGIPGIGALLDGFVIRRFSPRRRRSGQ
jgi:hypothetical protein